jgi:predicted lipoprotein
MRFFEAAYRAALVAAAPVSLMGCTIAPFPAESHAAKRTHFLPSAENGI